MDVTGGTLLSCKVGSETPVLYDFLGQSIIFGESRWLFCLFCCRRKLVGMGSE